MSGRQIRMRDLGSCRSAGCKLVCLLFGRSICSALKIYLGYENREEWPYAGIIEHKLRCSCFVSLSFSISLDPTYLLPFDRSNPI